MKPKNSAEVLKNNFSDPCKLWTSLENTFFIAWTLIKHKCDLPLMAFHKENRLAYKLDEKNIWNMTDSKYNTNPSILQNTTMRLTLLLLLLPVVKKRHCSKILRKRFLEDKDQISKINSAVFNKFWYEGLDDRIFSFSKKLWEELEV